MEFNRSKIRIFDKNSSEANSLLESELGDAAQDGTKLNLSLKNIL